MGSTHVLLTRLFSASKVTAVTQLTTNRCGDTTLLEQDSAALSSKHLLVLQPGKQK